MKKLRAALIVMAGLDPAILFDLDFTRVFMDGPIKPGHDKLSIYGNAARVPGYLIA